MHKNIIVSMDVIRKQNNKRKLKEEQKKAMDLRHVEHMSNGYRSTQSAFNDTHVADALKKVQENDTTVDVGFARFNGSNLYTESVGQSSGQQQKDTLNKPTKKLSAKKSIKKINIDKPIKTNKSPTTYMKEEITWDLICSQVGKERRKHNRLFEHTSRWGVNVSKQH